MYKFNKMGIVCLKQRLYVLIILIFYLFLYSCQKPDNTLERAESHFNKKEYTLAIPFYSKIIKESKLEASVEKAKKRLEESYYRAGLLFYNDKQYENSKEYFSLLILYFPDTLYQIDSEKKLIESSFHIGIKYLNEKNYHKSLSEFQKIKKNYSLSFSNTNKANNYIAENLYNIGLKHLGDKEYYYSIIQLNTLINDYPKSSWAEKAKPYLEESYFMDGKNQFDRNANHNALKIFKEMLVKFPDGKYSSSAKEYISKINANIKTPADKTIKSVTKEKSFEDKGNNPKEPYNNQDLKELFNYLNSEMEKNPEYLNRKIFPIYKNKYVHLVNLDISNHKRIDDSKINPKIKRFIDSFFSDKKSKNKSHNFQYLVYSLSIGNIAIYVNENDFFNLDFRKPLKPIEVRGVIYKISLDKEIQIFIVPDFFKQSTK